MSNRRHSGGPQAPGTDAVDPDELMGRISSLSFLRMAGISVAIHLVLIGVTSIGFLMDCSKYRTWHPDAEIRRITKEQRAEKLRKEREDAQRKLIADRKKGPGAETRPSSDVEKKVKRKSTTLPTRSGVGLEDIDDIK